MGLRGKVVMGLVLIFSVSTWAAEHAASEERQLDNGAWLGGKRPIAEGRVIHVPIEIKTVEQFKEFIKEKVAKGDEPLILLSGEEWCVNCVKLAPRLKGNIPAGKVIFELDTSETNKEKNVLISALAKSKSFTKTDSKGELKKTRPVFPSLWRIDGDLSDVSKVLVEEAAGADNVSHWLDNPPKRINHADWL